MLVILNSFGYMLKSSDFWVRDDPSGWWWRDTQILMKRLVASFHVVKSPFYLAKEINQVINCILSFGVGMSAFAQNKKVKKIFRSWCFHSFEVYSTYSSKMIDTSRKVSNFNRLFLKPNQFVYKKPPVVPGHRCESRVSMSRCRNVNTYTI